MSLSLSVYDPTNTTLIGALTNVLDAEFVDEYNTPGYGRATVILGSTEAGLLEQDRVVRVTYEGAARFAWVVEKLERSVVTDGNQRTVTASGPGLLSWLADALVFPQGGLRETSSENRPFNYASEDGPWTSSGNFTAPVGVRYRDDTTPRRGLPANWPDDNAQWIWSTDPNSQTVPEGTVNFFRSTFTLSESTRVRFFATADNHFDMYLDGSLVMSSSRFSENAPSFSQMTAYTTRLGAGSHTIAARVRNGKPWERYSVNIDASSDEVRVNGHGLINGTIVRLSSISKNGTGLSTGTNYFVRQATENTFKLSTVATGGTIIDILVDAEVDLRLYQDRYAGFLMTAFRINEDGRVDRTATPVRRTNQVAWQVSTIEPRWRPAMILRELVEEAADRGVFRLGNMSFTYDTTNPTTGSWSALVDLFLRVGSDLLSVYDSMIDLGVDFWINPANNEISAAEPRGSTKTVALEVASNLLAFETSIEPKVKTQALVQNTDGWQQVGVNTDTLGRREIFVEAGRTRSPATARVITNQLLNELARKRVTATTVEAIPVSTVKPYVHFDLGDVITIPGPTGSGTVSARVLSMAMRKDGGGVLFMPELEVL
jgi:hypothetical protein